MLLEWDLTTLLLILLVALLGLGCTGGILFILLREEEEWFRGLTPRERWAMWAEERRRREQPVADDGWGWISLLLILLLFFF